MGMRLGVTSASLNPNEDQSWLGSAHGTQECDSITLDAAAVTAVTEFASGVVPSGVPLTKLGSGRYGPAIKGAVDGTEVVAGHLFTTTDLTGGVVGSVGGLATGAAANTPAAIYWHGEVVASKIPTYTGGYGASDFTDGTVSAAGGNGQIRYV